MTGEERRNEILQTIKASIKPISGTDLAGLFGVSRQVIVQDIALLRASDYEILSTTKGYILDTAQNAVTKVFKVCHTDAEIEDELNCIVDAGGQVLDVFVEHKVYGTLKAALSIRSRRNVADFLKSLKQGASQPLKNTTSGYHYHTVRADCPETLDLIEEELRQRGYLVQRY